MDWIITLLVLASALFGWYRGLVRELISLVAWIAAFFLAVFFSPSLASEIDSIVAGETMRLVFSFSLIFVGVLIFSSLVQYVLKKFIKVIGLGGIDRLLGLVFGFVRGGLISIVFLILAREFDLLTDLLVNSQLSGHLLIYEQHVIDLLGLAKSSVDKIPELDPQLNSDV